MFLLNSFSIQMVPVPSTVTFTEIEKPDLKALESAVGHTDTAKVLGVPMNRVNVALKSGDAAIVAQLQGGRLVEGATTLPTGAFFKWIKVEVR